MIPCVKARFPPDARLLAASEILREAAMSAPTLISGDDLLLSLLLLRLLPIAILDPPQAWESKAASAAKSIHRFFRRALEAFYRQIPRRLVEYSGHDREVFGLQLFTSYLLESIEGLAASFGRPLPTDAIHLRGESFIRDALERGRGVVLWFERCYSGNIWNKVALVGAGFGIHQLAVPSHYYSDTRFGIQYLNRIWRNAEDRYLAERILLTDSRRLLVSRRIIELLRSNKIVGITATQGGAQTVATPALGGEVRVATGAPHFALRAHAALLPVYSFRDETGFVVEIQEPIDMAGADRQTAYQSAVEEYARRLDHYVQKYPASWNGYNYGSYSAKAAGR